MDNVIRRLKPRHDDDKQPSDAAIARFYVTKITWRGNYRRILAITPTSIVTVHPDSLAVTNVWRFAEDSDLASIEPSSQSGDHAELGGVFTLYFRKDKKGINSRDAKFACPERATLLTMLYNAILQQPCRAPHQGLRGERFPSYLLRLPSATPKEPKEHIQQEWLPTTLQVDACGIEITVNDDGSPSRRWDFVNAGAPAIWTLEPSNDVPNNAIVFALMNRPSDPQRKPVVLAVPAASWKHLLCSTTQMAEERLGIQLEVTAESSVARQLVEMVSMAERERAASPDQAPLGEWTALLMPESSQDRHQGKEIPLPRRLVLTPNSLIERDPDTYEILAWHQLVNVYALVRYAEDPQRLGIEWESKGHAPRNYSLPGRDALAVAILYAAQAAASRPVPVLSSPTDPGYRIYGIQDSTNAREEIERSALYHLGIAAAELVMQHPQGGIQASNAQAGDHALSIFEQRIKEFNANVPYSGLSNGTTSINLNSKVDDALLTALSSLLPLQREIGGGVAGVASLPAPTASRMLSALHAIQRLASSPPLALRLVGPSGGAGRIFAALLSHNDHIATEAANLLYRLFAPPAARSGAPPFASGPGPREGASSVSGGVLLHDDAALSRSAKSVCFISDSRCASLVSPMFPTHTYSTENGNGGDSRSAFPPPSPLLTAALMDVVVAVACKPGSKTTELSTRESLIREVSGVGRPLFALFEHPASRVRDAAALLTRTIAEGGAAAAVPMRRAALLEGALLHHLYIAVGLGFMEGNETDAFMRGGKMSAEIESSRDLVAMWADGYEPALNLMRRTFPPGLIRYLDSPHRGKTTLGKTQPGKNSEAPRLGPPDRRAVLGGGPLPSSSFSSTSLTVEQPMRITSRESRRQQSRNNWSAFWDAMDANHDTAVLIWNQKTRGELRAALEAEISLLAAARSTRVSHTPLWNAEEFEVVYPSLANRLVVANVYVDQLLGADKQTFYTLVDDPKSFFSGLYMHFLRIIQPEEPVSRRTRQSTKVEEALIRAMASTYAVHAATIGPLGRDVLMHLVDALDTCPNPGMRLRYLELLHAFVNVHHEQSMRESTAAGAIADEVDDKAQDASSKDGQALRGGWSQGKEDEEGDTAMRHQVIAENARVLAAPKVITLLVDVVASAHQHSRSATLTHMAVQPSSKLITGGASRGDAMVRPVCPALWSYLSQTLTKEQETSAKVSKEEIFKLYSQGEIDDATLFWSDNLESRPLASIRELRWWVSSEDRTPATGFAAASTALRILTSLVTLRPAVMSEMARNEGTLRVTPLPRAHQALLSVECLPRIAAVILTGEPILISEAAKLLYSLVKDNDEAMAGLYRTGVFFFLLAYRGSNLVEVARLLHATHLHQAHTPHHMEPTFPRQMGRSFLEALLPSSLILTLETYGPEAFATALAGDSDTPELIWTRRMREERLVPHMLRHIGELPWKLTECWSDYSCYEYTPSPPVGYPELAGEVFCHRYYLRHLCDESSFPQWPIVDHIVFLRALLESWREETSRQALGPSLEEAAAQLGLDHLCEGISTAERLTTEQQRKRGEEDTGNEDGGEPKFDSGAALKRETFEEEMKAAYRRLARKYHPDRNPSGREKFEAVKAAYERLQEAMSSSDYGQGYQGGPRPWRISLLLRAQCILYRRYPEVLSEYKYAGYPMLLQALKDIGPSCILQHSEAMPQHTEALDQICAAAQLVWSTCASSELNAEELTRCGGVAVLESFLSAFMADRNATSPSQQSSARNSRAVGCTTHLLQALSCIVAFASGREALESCPPIVADVVAGLESKWEDFPALIQAAVLCCVRMAESPALQTALLQARALPLLVRLLFWYDVTSTPTDKEWTTVPNADRNRIAALAMKALAVLASSPLAKAALNGLLTAPLARRLDDSDQDDLRLLKDLSSNSLATPRAVWSLDMKKELFARLEAMESAPDEETYNTLLENAATETYAQVRDEQVVAGVYVRLYVVNGADGKGDAIDDPVSFCKGLVTTVHALLSQGMDGLSSSNEGVSRRLKECLSALSRLLDSMPRLMGVLSTRPALDPLLSCIQLALIQEKMDRNDDEDEEHENVALAAIKVLDRLGMHAGCLRSMAVERSVMLFLWTAHDQARSFRKVLAKKEQSTSVRSEMASGSLDILLSLLCASPPDQATQVLGWVVSNGGVYMLYDLMVTNLELGDQDETQNGDDENEDGDRGGGDDENTATYGVALKAASVLTRASTHPLHGPDLVLCLKRVLLPPGLVTILQEGPPESVVAAMRKPTETPELVWTRAMQRSSAEEGANVAEAARQAHELTLMEAPLHGGSGFAWTPPQSEHSSTSWRMGEAVGDPYVAGVHVKLFLKDPGYPLRNPRAFLEGLMRRYVEEAESEKGKMELVISAAAVAIMRKHTELADHAVSLGYVAPLISILAGKVPDKGSDNLPDDVSASALRLLHATSVSTIFGSALANCSPPAVPVLCAALGWGGAAAVLAVEILKRGLSRVNRDRNGLVAAAIACEVVPTLLEALDWRRSQREDPDQAVLHVLMVDVLNLLADNLEVRSVLEESPVWAAYRGQKHDLYLPASGVDEGAGAAGLLKGAEALKFALPAPEKEKEGD